MFRRNTWESPSSWPEQAQQMYGDNVQRLSEFDPQENDELQVIRRGSPDRPIRVRFDGNVHQVSYSNREHRTGKIVGKDRKDWLTRKGIRVSLTGDTMAKPVEIEDSK